MGAKTSVRINARLVDEAVKIFGAKSRTEAVHMSLHEIVSLRRFKKLMKKHAGKLEFARRDQ
jgi:Arc/MetJ family transcription regulator